MTLQFVQVSTSAIPAFAKCGRDILSKLPELRRDQRVINANMKDRNWNKNYLGKPMTSDVRLQVPNEMLLIKYHEERSRTRP